jgi:protein-L-isoaspartate(D-aspartate) O-methyltransferase
MQQRHSLSTAGILLMLAACRRNAPDAGPGEPASHPPLADAAPAVTAAAPETPPAEPDPPEARALREELVRRIEAREAPWGSTRTWDTRVLDAMRRVARHLFIPGVGLRRAYEDRPLPIGHEQTISQPTIVAIMSDALALRGGERVLEIGTGSGYQAAVLSLLAREVFTIEIVAPLGETAKQRLRELGYRNVNVRVGDGYKGWPEHAPFDRILLTAAPPEVPQALVQQLKEGGVLVAPVGDTHPQRLVRWTKTAGKLKKEDLGPVLFVPMVKGSKPEP